MYKYQIPFINTLIHCVNKSYYPHTYTYKFVVVFICDDIFGKKMLNLCVKKWWKNKTVKLFNTWKKNRRKITKEHKKKNIK